MTSYAARVALFFVVALTLAATAAAQSAPSVGEGVCVMYCDSSWSPSFGSSVSQTELPSPAEVAVGKEISKREDLIGKLTRRREAFRVALEKLDRSENWRQELEYWVQESQSAQIGALTTSLGLMVGVAGPVRDALEVHHENSVALWDRAQQVRARLEEIDSLLKEPSLSATQVTEVRRAADGLRFTYDDLTRSMKSEWQLAQSFENLDRSVDRLLEAVRWIELARGLREKQSLLLTTKLIQDFMIDLLRDIGLVKVQKELVTKGMTEGAQYTRLAQFGIDYGYHSTRFYLAWRNVHDILLGIDDENAGRTALAHKITETTDEIIKARAELQQLQAARGNRKEIEKAVSEVRQEELREAYQASEWFSSRNGVRALGMPITDRN